TMLVDQLRVEGVRVDTEEPLRRDRDRSRLRHLPWVGVDGGHLLADRELHPGPVVDRPAAGGNGHRLAMLPLGELAERRRPDALQPDRARERRGEDHDEDREQQADAAICLPVLHAYRPRLTYPYCDGSA